MIVNAELLVNTQKTINIEQFQRKITEALLLNLYIGNFIKKGEYEELCRQFNRLQSLNPK